MIRPLSDYKSMGLCEFRRGTAKSAESNKAFFTAPISNGYGALQAVATPCSQLPGAGGAEAVDQVGRDIKVTAGAGAEADAGLDGAMEIRAAGDEQAVPLC